MSGVGALLLGARVQDCLLCPLVPLLLVIITMIIMTEVTNAQAKELSFVECLLHYMDWEFIENCNWKAVELAIMVEVGTHVREVDPMKKEVKERAFFE